jgi:hypothetical protein
MGIELCVCADRYQEIISTASKDVDNAKRSDVHKIRFSA